MFSPLFDGQFRSKRSVSLRGASKQGELSKSLLNKARHLRQEREWDLSIEDTIGTARSVLIKEVSSFQRIRDMSLFLSVLIRKQERIRNSSAITIQSFYRSHIVRQSIYRQLRLLFDNGYDSCSSPAHLYRLSSQLLLFYSESTDHQRLVTLCQKWIHYKVAILQDLVLSSKGRPFYLLCNLIAVCLSSLDHTPNQVLSGPLRMIDVYINDGHPSITEFVLRKGYYRTLRTLIETRLPVPDEDTPLTPLAASLLDYSLRPIKSKITESYRFIILELLATPLSPHLCHLIIPSLQKSNINLLLLLELASSQTTPTSSTLCYCILKLVQQQIELLSCGSLCHLLLLISNVMGAWSREREKEIELEEEDILDEDEDEEEMDQDPISGTTALNYCIMDQISNGPIINTVLQYHNRLELFVEPLCSICYHILSKSQLSSPFRQRLIVSLSISTITLKQIWESTTTMTIKRTFGPSVTVLDQFRRGLSLPPHEGQVMLHKLTSFSVLLFVALSSLHDIELFTKGPFTMADMNVITLKLRDVFVNINLNAMQSHLPSLPNDRQVSTAGINAMKFLSNVLCRLLKVLYDRNSRLGFCTTDSWAVLSLDNMPVDLFLENDEDEDLPRPLYPAVVFKQAYLLKRTPFVFQFIHRVTFFHKLIASARYNIQGRFQEFLLGPSLSISVRRARLYEDAFSKLAAQDLRQRLRVQLINDQGLEEAGIDGGGLFREFLSETLKIGFDPNRGFFTTTKEGYLYPNPTVHLVSADYILHYKFLGSLLGKALLEQMMVELPFASFFLRKLTSGGRGWVDTHHLGSLDPELYHHLLWLKNYRGDFEELGLDFTAVSNEFGQSRVIELKPNGANIQVTSSNCIEYIHALADYHLNHQIDSQFRAFREGLSMVIPIQWLTLFNQTELQTLVSGAEEPISMTELKKYTIYSGSYKEDHECMEMFWDIVSEFTELQKRQLLKFVTSCSRPPLLGFKELHPPFSILSAKETDHLPSASTCMHLLKLPMFETKKEMKEKLVYAISSGAGFELS